MPKSIDRDRNFDLYLSEVGPTLEAASASEREAVRDLAALFASRRGYQPSERNT